MDGTRALFAMSYFSHRIDVHIPSVYPQKQNGL
jgi:hypothetical protein